jgi:hypothetical protein
MEQTRVRWMTALKDWVYKLQNSSLVKTLKPKLFLKQNLRQYASHVLMIASKLTNMQLNLTQRGKTILSLFFRVNRKLVQLLIRPLQSLFLVVYKIGALMELADKVPLIQGHLGRLTPTPNMMEVSRMMGDRNERGSATDAVESNLTLLLITSLWPSSNSCLGILTYHQLPTSKKKLHDRLMKAQVQRSFSHSLLLIMQTLSVDRAFPLKILIQEEIAMSSTTSRKRVIVDLVT